MNESFSRGDVFRHLLRQLDVVSVIDILLVATAIYFVLALAKNTRAMQLLKGLVTLLVVMQAAQWLGMDTLQWVIRQAIFASALAVVILFQPEIRAALDQLGRGQLELLGIGRHGASDHARQVQEITLAVEQLAGKRIGALLVIARQTGIEDVIETGTPLGAKLGADFLVTLFYPGNPLHDGAVVVREGNVVAAGCILPLSHTQDLPRTIGTRHRAALGLSEETDAIIVVVSEETGNISLAHGGSMNSILQPRLLSDELLSLLGREEGAARLRPFARDVGRSVGRAARTLPGTTLGTLKTAFKLKP